MVPKAEAKLLHVCPSAGLDDEPISISQREENIHRAVMFPYRVPVVVKNGISCQRDFPVWLLIEW